MAETYSAFANKHLDVRTRSGVEWMCLCPYHEDSNPSFAINVRKGLFVCYACGAKGKVDQLAGFLKVGNAATPIERTVDDVKKKLHELNSEPPQHRGVSSLWVDHWAEQPQAEALWESRGIDKKTMEEFGLGYDGMHDALTIPVHHPAKRQVLSVIRRRMNPEPGQPKYHYERGFKISEHLFGSWQVRTRYERNMKVAITEGSIDAMAMWSAGIPAVALLGARVSETQSRLLRQLDPMAFVVMTDADEAGRTAAQQIVEVLSGSGIMVEAPRHWPKGKKDPGEMTEDERKASFTSSNIAKVST